MRTVLVKQNAESKAHPILLIDDEVNTEEEKKCPR